VSLQSHEITSPFGTRRAAGLPVLFEERIARVARSKAGAAQRLRSKGSGSAVARRIPSSMQQYFLFHVAAKAQRLVSVRISLPGQRSIKLVSRRHLTASQVSIIANVIDGEGFEPVVSAAHASRSTLAVMCDDLQLDSRFSRKSNGSATCLLTAAIPSSALQNVAIVTKYLVASRPVVHPEPGVQFAAAQASLDTVRMPVVSNMIERQATQPGFAARTLAAVVREGFALQLLVVSHAPSSRFARSRAPSAVPCLDRAQTVLADSVARSPLPIVTLGALEASRPKLFELHRMFAAPSRFHVVPYCSKGGGGAPPCRVSADGAMEPRQTTNPMR
jgi:hypothetical protein